MPPIDSTLPPCTDYVVMTSDPAAAAVAAAAAAAAARSHNHHHLNNNNHHNAHQRHVNGSSTGVGGGVVMGGGGGGGGGGAGGGGGGGPGGGGPGGGPTNSTPAVVGLVGQDEDLSALLYIVVTLLFYSMGIVVGIITYLKRERADMEEEKVFDMYLAIKRDPFNMHRQEKVQQMARRLRKMEQAKADRLERERQERERMALVASWDDAHDLTGSDGEDPYSKYAPGASPCHGDGKKNKHVKITDCVPIRTPSTRSSRRGSSHGCMTGAGSDGNNSDAGTAALYPLVLSTASMLFGSTRSCRSPVFHHHPHTRQPAASPSSPLPLPANAGSGGGGGACGGVSGTGASASAVVGGDYLAPPRRFSGDHLAPPCSTPITIGSCEHHSDPSPGSSSSGDGGGGGEPQHRPDATPSGSDHPPDGPSTCSRSRSSNSDACEQVVCEPPRRPSSSCVRPQLLDHEASSPKASSVACEHHGRSRAGEHHPACPRRSVIYDREQPDQDDSGRPGGVCEHHGRRSVVGGCHEHSGRKSIAGGCHEHHGRKSIVGGCCEHHGRRSVVGGCLEHHGRKSIVGGSCEHHGRGKTGERHSSPRKSIIGGEREHLLGGSSSPRSGEHERRGALPVGAKALNVREAGTANTGKAASASSASSSPSSPFSCWSARNAETALLMPGPVVNQPGRAVRNSALPSDLD